MIPGFTASSRTYLGEKKSIHCALRHRHGRPQPQDQDQRETSPCCGSLTTDTGEDVFPERRDLSRVFSKESSFLCLF